MGKKLTSVKGYTKSNGTKVKSHRRRTAKSALAKGVTLGIAGHCS